MAVRPIITVQRPEPTSTVQQGRRGSSATQNLLEDFGLAKAMARAKQGNAHDVTDVGDAEFLRLVTASRR